MYWTLRGPAGLGLQASQKSALASGRLPSGAQTLLRQPWELMLRSSLVRPIGPFPGIAAVVIWFDTLTLNRPPDPWLSVYDTLIGFQQMF